MYWNVDRRNVCNHLIPSATSSHGTPVRQGTVDINLLHKGTAGTTVIKVLCMVTSHSHISNPSDGSLGTRGLDTDFGPGDLYLDSAAAATAWFAFATLVATESERRRSSRSKRSKPAPCSSKWSKSCLRLRAVCIESWSLDRTATAALRPANTADAAMRAAAFRAAARRSSLSMATLQPIEKNAEKVTWQTWRENERNRSTMVNQAWNVPNMIQSLNDIHLFCSKRLAQRHVSIDLNRLPRGLLVLEARPLVSCIDCHN